MPSALVTGASRGLGEAIARRLRQAGWRVYGGVRHGDDEPRLRAAGVEPVRLDVTSSDDLASVRARLEEELGSTGLDALIANAGIAVAGPVELVPVDAFRAAMEVNVLGSVRTVQAFLPLVRRARGRIVLMSSVSGLVALPLLAPYAASKFALEALGDCLRVELAPFGVHVILVEPGSVRTRIWDRSWAASEAQLQPAPPETEAVYARYRRAAQGMLVRVAAEALSPDVVAVAVERALRARRPPARLLVAAPRRAWETRLLRRLPTSLRDRLIAVILRRLAARATT